MNLNSQNLSIAMANACMSSSELQRIAGVSNVTLCKIQNGTQDPRPITIGKLAKALNVSVEYLTEEA